MVFTVAKMQRSAVVRPHCRGNNTPLACAPSSFSTFLPRSTPRPPPSCVAAASPAFPSPGLTPHRRSIAARAAPAEPDVAAARLDGARLSQRRSTELLARLLEAGDPTGVAREHLEGLTEEFFMTAGTYLTLARQEGNAEVATRLERSLTAAWVVKQSTLRPELQLLNSLVRAEGEAARREIYTSGGPDLLSTLSMSERWFAGALSRMVADVERQTPHPGKADLMARLRAIQRETEALEAQATRQARRGQEQDKQ